MKKITIFFICYFTLNLSFSQGTDVLSSEQFCSGTSQLTFNNVFGMPDNTPVGCLGSIPNAAYFYLQIDQPGDLIFTINQEDTGGTPIDVDFIAWGPFIDIADANANISFTNCPTCPNNTANPTFYPYATDQITDCSFSIAPTETMNILNAMQGEVYVVLITNYNGSQGIIDFQQTSGNGTTTCASLPVCGSQYYDMGGTSGPYSGNESTTISPYFAGGTVTVDFTSVDIPDAGDVLTVYNGPNNTFPILGTVTSAPVSFTSNTAGNPTGEITFDFVSDGDANVGTGWVADITCTPPPTPPTCGFTFYDSGGSGGDYNNNELQTTTFYPDIAGDAVTATFTAFDLESCCDELRIYDGPNASFPLLGVFAGNTISGPFTSSDASGALTFVFDSDSSVTESGWAANLTCAPYVPPVICGSTFYDSGGVAGNYSNNELSTTTLTPDIPGTAITVTFTAFDLESCCDDLLVYDGPDATYPLLGTFSGTAIPGPFTSTDPSGSLTFVFDSDSSVTESGWVADVTCGNNCNLMITDTNYPIGADECNLDYTELTTNAPIPAPTTTVFVENFNATNFPAGWTVTNGAPSADWIVSTTNNAGGTANEANLEWTTGDDVSNWRLRSPAIDITGQTNLQLSFKHELNIFLGGDISIRVQTSLDGTNWTNQYTALNVPNDIAATTENIDISALDGNTTLYIRFRLNGDTLDLFDWFIDDVIVTADGTPSPPQVTWSPTTGLYTDNTLTTAYAGGFAGTVYAAPNGIQTYTATDNNACTDTATVIYNKKTWNGSSNNNWYIGSNWTPTGVPTIDNCIVIPDNSTVPNAPLADKAQTPIPLPPQPAQARSLTLESNAYLELETNTELIVQEWVNVQNTGVLNLKSSSSLIQIEDAAVNSGTIHVQRSPNFDESAVANSEYVYWASPVANYQVANISPSSSLIFDWTPTVAGNGTGNHGEWFSASGNMINGAGYIVRGLAGTPTTIPSTTYTIANNTALFSGVPNNGIITKQIFHGGYNGGNYPGIGNTATNEDDNWNLIGNPYPSAISANAFTNLNTNINGTVYVWPHNSSYSIATQDPFYEDYVYNYDGNDYIEHNNTGSNPPGTSDLFIGSGQAFFVMMNHSATSGSTVTFNNNMRQVLSTYNNNTFFRSIDSDQNTNRNTIERHRIWLDLLSPNDITNTILVGYVNDATNDFDRLYDGYDFSGENNAFYSVLNNENLSIQGRSLPFLQDDIVPLGIISNETGSHTIAINSLDGLFSDEEQTIYIEDTALNIIHDIRMSPYTFTIEAGIHNDRFILRYTNQSLGVNPTDGYEGITIIAPKSEYVKVSSEIGTISTFTIYDIIGRSIFTKSNINESGFLLNDTALSDGTYIVKVVLNNGKQKTQKVVIRQ
ncbi:CUB domain-containing protein [uncultured Psychroserpens sp.]|uniref:CUB domain-containing protein n=1 Tax=uncultured Psychroserpens sp. TaxID=255436 RepID=UPI002632F71C|nr:CUB domain-containing protein [uncultured Psychroserpens sp.]